MTVLSASELQILRTIPHRTKLYLSIYQPSVALACRVNDASIAKGKRSITYDSVTSGNYNLIESGMMMLVGTTPGGSEKGRVRVKSATSSTITVAENSHINWENGDYLTVLRYFEIVAMYPRIVQDDDFGNTTWYKDYDIAYSNQNDILGSFVCMGSHYAGFLNSGQCNVYYTASGTYNMLGDNLTYSWFFEGATTTGSSLHTPGYITYTTPGHYTTRLTVTSSSGAVDKSYRHISIYNRPGTSNSNIPIQRWELQDISGSRDNGGYTAKIRVYDMANKTIIRDGALIVIFSEDYYGDIKKSIGGNVLNRESIVYVGYIINGSIKYNYSDSYIEFEVGSPTEIMKYVEGFSVACNSSENPSSQVTNDEDIPSAWVLVKDMDIRRGLYHYLRWHSTTLLCNDIEFRGTDKKVQYMDTDRSSLYDAAYSWINGTLMGEFVCDRQGKMWAEVSVMATDNASGTFPTAMSIYKGDWIGEPEIEEILYAPLSQLELGGIAYSGAYTGTYSAHLSHAPGVSPAYYGDIEQIEGLVINNQDDLNTLSGNVFAYRNARYPSLMIDLIGNYRNLDIAPQELISINIASSDIVRNIIFTEKPFTIRGMVLSYSSKSEYLQVKSLDLHEVTQGFAGDTIEIPPEAPSDDDYDDWDDWDIDPPTPPDFGDIIEPPPPDYGDPNLVFVVGNSSHGLTIARTENFNTTSPNWVDMLSSPVGMPPSGTFYAYVPRADNPSWGGYWMTDYGIWYIAKLTEAPSSVVSVNILTLADMNTLISDSGFRFYGLSCGTNNKIFVAVGKVGTGKAPVLRYSIDSGTWEYSIAWQQQFGSWYDYYEYPYHSIVVDYYQPNILFVRRPTGGGGGDAAAVRKSTDGGQTWNELSIPPSSNNMIIFPIQYQSYSNSVYWYSGISGTSSSGSDVIQANGNFSAFLFRTPTYSGADYGTGVPPINGGKHICISPMISNPSYIAALLYRNKTGASYNPPVLFTSADGGTSWTARKVFSDAYSPPHCLVTHPYNPGRMYIMGTSNRDGFRIGSSSDYGVTWIDKTGDWNRVIGSYPDTVNTSLIIPIF